MCYLYLNDQNWADITREERYFCAELYYAIKGNEDDFVTWLMKMNEEMKLKNDPAKNWEIGYEVCFYRDLFISIGSSVKEMNFSPKRTFDLCLFSEDQIVIIEAKAHGKFRRKQLNNLENDKEDVKCAIKSAMEPKSDIPEVDVKVVALASSRYFGKREQLYGPENKAPDEFDGHFTWRRL